MLNNRDEKAQRSWNGMNESVQYLVILMSTIFIRDQGEEWIFRHLPPPRQHWSKLSAHPQDRRRILRRPLQRWRCRCRLLQEAEDHATWLQWVLFYFIKCGMLSSFSNSTITYLIYCNIAKFAHSILQYCTFLYRFCNVNMQYVFRILKYCKSIWLWILHETIVLPFGKSVEFRGCHAYNIRSSLFTQLQSLPNDKSLWTI